METTASPTNDLDAAPKRRRRTKLIALIAGIILVAIGGAATVALALGPDRGTLRYEWSIGDRYGLDADNDGIVDDHDGTRDLAGDKAFIQNPTYQLTFDSCSSTAVTERSSLNPSFTLTLTGPESKTVTGTNCKMTVPVTKLGTFKAVLDLKVAGVSVDTREETITAKDNLVVSVGDSVASGEGNPDTLESGTFWSPKWENKQCHRTSLAGPAQAALRMERRDPHSAVTFVHLACSGASITTGLLGDYDGQDPSAGTKLKPQMDQLKELVGARPVDAMTVSIGANDAEFSAVVKACLIQTNCHLPNGTGQKNGVELFDEKAPLITKNYALLDARLDKMAKQEVGDVKLRGKVFVTEYMDVTKDDDGSYCTGKTAKEREAGNDAGGTANTDGLNQAEMTWADGYVQDGLNKRVTDGIAAANANGGAEIQFIGGIKAKFAKHGYCAQDRYIRTLTESALYQRGVDGAFHPNAEGHLFGYADRIEDTLAPALGIGGDKAPLKFDAAGQLGDDLGSWLATLDESGALDQVTNALPFGAREEVQKFLRDKFFGKFLPFVEDTIASGNTKITELSEKLDDLDGDGKPGVDAFGVANLDVDMTGDIEPKLPSKTYDITFTVKGSLAVDPDLALKAGKLGLTGQKTDGKVEFSQTVKLHIDFTKPKTDRFYLTIPSDGLNGEIKINLGGDFGATDPNVGPDRNPIEFTSGGLGLKAKGIAKTDLTMGYSIKDPSGDGKIDATEIGHPLDWVKARCSSGSAKVDLKASSTLVGFTNTIGKVQLDDANLCDGVNAPTVDLSDLGTFEGVTVIDFVNGLAQLTTSLKNIQDANEVDIPFVKEGLSGLISTNEKLVKFFTDNGLTDPNNPMATVTFDPTKKPDLDTIDELLPKLAQSLGVPLDQLKPRVVDQRLLLDLSVNADPPAQVGKGTLDFGDQLSKTGVVDISASTKATIDPALTVKLGLGIDLRPDMELGDRFFFQLGDGPEITADAKVTADAKLSAKLALLDLDLADDNAAGAVTLLDRKDATKPLLSIDLKGTIDNTPDDNRLTLKELATPSAKAPFAVTINGKVPAFGLTADAKLAGTTFASGKVAIDWPDITVPSGLKVTADANFRDNLLPFAYDPSNPRATITQILKAAHTSVQKLRAGLTANPAIARSLPLTGKSAAEIEPVLAKVEDKLAQLIELDETLTLTQLEQRVEKELGSALGVANDQLPGLLTFRYQKQTTDKPAALLADLKVGFCSNSRKDLAGCNKISELGPYPLNLSLGQSADSMAAVTADGRVTIGYDARINLTVGVEFPRVSVDANGVPVPPATGVLPKVFVQDTSSFELGIGANVTGQFAGVLGPVEVKIGNGTKAADARLAARYVIRSKTADAANPQRIYDSAIPAWVTSIIPDPTKGGSIKDTTTTKSNCADAADACAVLPITINGAYVGDVTFKAPDLLTPSGWTVDGGDIITNLGNENIQYAILIGGIESFVQRLEASLKAMPPGKNIPLLGVDPTAGAKVLEDFRKGFVEPAQDLVNKINAANKAGVVQTNVQDFVYEKIGPDSSLKLLRDGPDADTTISKADIVVDLKCKISGVVKTCASTDAATTIEDLQIKVPLAKGGTATSKPLDSGFPGLRLKSADGFSAKAGFEMDLAFGIDRTNGFYIPTNAFGTQPELRVQATASLPSSMDAQLAFIPVKITDNTPGVPEVAATVGVDLAAGGSDDKITLGQLGSAQITPSLQACANVRLGLETGAAKKFPAFKTDLTLTGGFNCQAGGVTQAPASNGGIAIAFDNVRINAGSVINDFIGPIAKTVQKYTAPIKPTMDALEKPIPGIKEASRAVGAKPPTWWDLMNLINEIKMKTGEGDQLAMIKKVRTVMALADQLAPGVGNAQDISLGSFKLDSTVAANPSAATDFDALMTGENYGGNTSDLTTRLQGAGIPVEIASKVQKTAPYQSLTFPALEKPQMLFQLLLGKDVPLVRFEAGGSFLHVPVGPYTFPVGPATLYFGGALDVSGHFAAGFDTYGIRQAYSMLTDDDPTNDSFGSAASGLLGGFYLDDYDAAGKDVPELQAQAEVTVGAGVGIPGFGVFAEGGVHADAQIDLKTTDGKLRPQQVITQLRKNPNPVCIFDAKAKIDAFVRVVVSNPIKDVAFPVANSVILDEPDLTAFCNTQQDDTVAKLTGRQYTDGTLELFTTSQSDPIFVTQRGNGKVDVSSKNVVETFEGVSKIFVDGAAGDDQITLTTDNPAYTDIPAHVCGGAGKDHLSVDIGPATIYGDAGTGSKTVENGVDKPLPCASGPGAADSIQGSTVADTIAGQDGGDDITGGTGNDKLTGGNGTDTILPGAGDDEVDGGGNDDIVSYADRASEPMTIDLRSGKTSGATGTAEKDALTSIETGVGGPDNDTLYGSPDAVVIDGGTGNDTLNGSTAVDVLIGAAGDDVLLGNDGDDMMYGSYGNDRMVGGPGGDIYEGGESSGDIADFSAETSPIKVTLDGKADDGRADQARFDNVAASTDIVWGTPKDDALAAGTRSAELQGRGGDDTIDGPGLLIGGDGDDLLRGSDQRDTLQGNAGKDELYGGAEQDDLDGGTQDDYLQGGQGPDRMAGGDGFDEVDYANRTNPIVVRLTDGARDGEGVTGSGSNVSADCVGLFCDEVRPDNEKIVGGSGDDTLDGDSFDQTLVGGPGDDALTGHAGIDRFEGGSGKDDARDGDFQYSKPDATGTGDTYLMGADDDYVSGTGGDEHIELGTGNDGGALNGTGKVFLDMGEGNDRFDTDQGDHTVIGGPGNDSLTTYAGKKDVDMGEGDDYVGLNDGSYATRALMGAGDDEFNGASSTKPGPDTVDGGPGNDHLDTSAGNDTITDLEGNNTVYAGLGDDTITTGPGSDESRGDDGNDTLTDAGNNGEGRVGWGPDQRMWGGAGNDTITVNGSTPVEDNVTGDEGNDVIRAGNGPQSIQGGEGADDIDGGAGADRINGGNGDDTVRGGDGDDTVQGGDGTNVLFGGTGADRIEGGSGKDTVSYADRNAPVSVTIGIFGADDGNAVDESATVPAKRDDIAFTVETVVGTELDDVIRVGSIESAATADIDGRGGKDTLVADRRSKLVGGSGDDTLLGSPFTDTLEGGIGNDLLAGGAEKDAENGGDGNDRLDQGSAIDGGDTLVGGPGTDVADYSARPSGQAIAFTPGAGGANDGAAGEGDDADATIESARTQGSPTKAPTVTVTMAKTTAVVGETVNATITVSGTEGVPVGSVEVTENIPVGTAVLDASGKATVPVRFTSAGNRVVTARFQGGPQYRSATSAAAPVTVGKATTEVTLTPLNSPTKTGDLSKLRVELRPTVGTTEISGLVKVTEGATELWSGNVTTKGEITLPTALAAGRHDLVATWPGTNETTPATGTATVLVTADGKGTTSTTVSSSRNPATDDTPVTLTATVVRTSGTGSPTGTVTFLAGTDVLGTASVDGAGMAVINRALLSGTHQITARYEGNDALAGSTSSAITQQVTGTTGPVKVATSTKVVRSGNDLVATVTPASGTATGQVRFSIDGADQTPVALTGTTAKLALPALAAGDHTVTARYLGSTTHAASTSPELVITVTVTKVSTTTAVVRYGDSLVATVTPASGTATGQVTFTIDGSAKPPVNLTGTTATLPLPALAPGDHTVTAAYSGSATHNPSTSAALKVTISTGTTPAAPSAPTVTAITGTTASVTWNAPANPGGSAITAYRVTVKADVAGTVVAQFETTNANRTASVTGLTPGRLYRFSVAARNGTGIGNESALSAHALPPFKTVDAFTTQQFKDFANRVPTAAELSAWRTKVTNGSTAPKDLLSQAMDFPYAAKYAPIVRLFNAYFGRLPDQSGLDYWAGKYRSGVALNTISASFAGSGEFKNKYGALSNRDFVLLIYKNVLQRNPDASGVNYWTGKLDKGTSRGVVMTNFSESSEYLRKTAATTDLVVSVRTMLQRVPTTAERTEWEAKLKAGTPRAELLGWLLTQPAYDARV
jgi:Ca2+-binding RTX toxin-like protein/nitrogen fixation protein FixH